MPLNLTAGEKFPDHRLTDHTHTDVSISEVAGGQPLFLAFYRGPW